MSVEFLPDDQAGAEPARPREPGGSRRWRALAVVLAAAAIVFAVTRREPESARVAAPTPTPTPTIVRAPDPGCRGVPDCAVRFDVPATIRRLARLYLPPDARLRVHTVVAVSTLAQQDLLVERDIDAVAGSVTIAIRVQRGGSATQAIVPDPPGVGSALLSQVNSGFVVRLQYLAPETVAPMVDRLRALIGDAQLTAT